MMKQTVLHLLLAGCMASVAFAQPAEPTCELEEARKLYASARYDEALTTLNELLKTCGEGDLSVNQYRSLCLLALGNEPEAAKAIEAVIKADPNFVPSETEASPRVREAFKEVRRRLLPEIVRERYADAKAAYDRKDWQTALRQFKEVLPLLENPEIRDELADLRTLAGDFIKLAETNAAPPAAAPAKPKPEPPAPTPPPDAPANLPADRFYTPDDRDVTQPTAIRQERPKVPARIVSQMRHSGRIEIQIDEKGRVIGIKILQGMHPIYDQMIKEAVPRWLYQPARRDGVPVKYRMPIDWILGQNN